MQEVIISKEIRQQIIYHLIMPRAKWEWFIDHHSSIKSVRKIKHQQSIVASCSLQGQSHDCLHRATDYQTSTRLVTMTMIQGIRDWAWSQALLHISDTTSSLAKTQARTYSSRLIHRKIKPSSDSRHRAVNQPTWIACLTSRKSRLNPHQSTFTSLTVLISTNDTWITI